MAKKQAGKAPMKKMAVKSVSVSTKLPVKGMKVKSDTTFTPKVKKSAGILEGARNLATSAAVFGGMVGAVKGATKKKK